MEHTLTKVVTTQRPHGTETAGTTGGMKNGKTIGENKTKTQTKTHIPKSKGQLRDNSTQTPRSTGGRKENAKEKVKDVLSPEARVVSKADPKAKKERASQCVVALYAVLPCTPPATAL